MAAALTAALVLSACSGEQDESTSTTDAVPTSETDVLASETDAASGPGDVGTATGTGHAVEETDTDTSTVTVPAEGAGVVSIEGAEQIVADG